MSKIEKAIVVFMVAVVVFVVLMLLYENPQVRQTLCTLRCQHIENEAAWEACIGECLVEIANDQ